MVKVLQNKKKNVGGRLGSNLLPFQSLIIVLTSSHTHMQEHVHKGTHILTHIFLLYKVFKNLCYCSVGL